MNNILVRKHPHPKKKLVGRGGKRGKTSGRGHKGQKQHGSHGMRPQMRDIIKKIPKMRGRGLNSNKAFREKPSTVNVGALNIIFASGATVDRSTLREHALIPGGTRAVLVKILGTGEITKKLSIVGCEVSASARAKIEAAGGTIA